VDCGVALVNGRADVLDEGGRRAADWRHWARQRAARVALDTNVPADRLGTVPVSAAAQGALASGSCPRPQSRWGSPPPSRGRDTRPSHLVWSATQPPRRASPSGGGAAGGKPAPLKPSSAFCSS